MIDNISPDPWSADIKIGNTFTSVRGNGYGKSAWIAKIVGRIDCRNEFSRFFCGRNKQLSEDGKTGCISFQLREYGLYEFRKFCVGDKRGQWRWDGFIYLFKDWSRKLLTKEEAFLVAEEEKMRLYRDDVSFEDFYPCEKI